MVPGMGHCQGGPGTDVFDKVGALDRWVKPGRSRRRSKPRTLPPAWSIARVRCAHIRRRRATTAAAAPMMREFSLPVDSEPPARSDTLTSVSGVKRTRRRFEPLRGLVQAVAVRFPVGSRAWSVVRRREPHRAQRRDRRRTRSPVAACSWPPRCGDSCQHPLSSP